MSHPAPPANSRPASKFGRLRTAVGEIAVLPNGWMAILGGSLLLQLINQAAAFGSGIYILRQLDKQEYAFYTVAITLQIVIKTLSDLGVGDALLTIGGQCWQDKLRLGGLMALARRVRFRFLLLSALVSIPITIGLFTRVNGSVLYSLGVWALLAVSQIGALRLAIASVPCRLHGQNALLQKTDIASSLLRLVLLVGLSFFGFNALGALAITAATTFFQMWLMEYYAERWYDRDAASSYELKPQLLSLVHSQTPNALFTCLQGQISVWLMSIFGSATAVADLGALSRLGTVFSAFGVLVPNVLQPRFARLTSRSTLAKRYVQSLVGLALLGGVVLLAAYLFPQVFLFILGSQYAHLHWEMLCMIAAASFHLLYMAVWSLNAARGWTKGLWITIPLILLGQVISLLTINVQTVSGVIIFGVTSSLPAFFYLLFLAWRGLASSPSVERVDAVITT